MHEDVEKTIIKVNIDTMYIMNTIKNNINANLEPPKDDNKKPLQEYDMKPIRETPETTVH